MTPGPETRGVVQALNASERSGQRPYFDWRVVVFYLLAFAAGGAVKPFLNLYLIEVGLTGTQIGIVQGWTALTTVVITPALGWLADHMQCHRFMLGLLVFLKGFFAMLVPLSDAWLWLLIVVSLRVTFAGSCGAMTNRLTLAHMSAYSRQDLGRWWFLGSISFAGTSMLTGILARGRSVAVLFPLGGVLGAIAIFFVGAFPARLGRHQPVQASPDPGPRSSSHTLFFFAILFLFTFGLSGLETFAYVFLAKDLGAGNDLVGFLGAVAWLAGLPAYYAADRLIRRWGATATMATSMGLYVVGWIGYVLIPTPALALPIVALEGLGQALYMVSTVILLSEIGLPERAATDQMLAQMTIPGLARMIAQPISGRIFDALGARALFGLDALIVSVTVILFLTRARRFGIHRPWGKTETAFDANREEHQHG